MPSDRPSAEQIESWIAGTLPDEVAESIEAYFEAHPEELPGHESDPEVRLISEAAQSDFTHPDLTVLIDTLKSQNFTSLTEIGEGGWVDLLTPTTLPGILGTMEHYEVIEVIATTGMAAVIKARDPKLDRFVALKILSPVLATNATARARFLQEARAMATLEHENILPIHGIYNDTTPWFAMRFIEGGSLQDALDAKAPRLSTSGFLESLASQMGEALKIAHEAGIIHRDIKPANILLDDSSDRIWLTDFGIARSTEDPGLTYGCAIAGTPRYMSPEQAAGEPVDHHSDFFSLGSVLYHCAAGRAPFEGENSTAILHKVMESRPASVSRLNPKLPSWFTDLINGLLQKSPKDRPDLQRALAEKKKVPLSFKSLVIPLLAGLLIWGIFAWPSKTSDLPQITIEESSERFTDLAEAISKAPPNATLILRGDFVVESPIETRPAHGLHLRAAEGSQPSIRFTKEAASGITVYGETSATGIRFISETAGSKVRTTALCAKSADTLTVKDCRFESSPLTSTHRAWGIKAMAATKTEVRNCNFQGAGMYAVLLYDGSFDEKPRDGDLTMSDCSCETRGVLYQRGDFPESKFRSEFTKITFSGRYFAASSIANDLCQTEIIVRDSRITVDDYLLGIRKATSRQLAQKLTWKGERNQYSLHGFIRTEVPELYITDYDVFLKALPMASEIDSTFSSHSEK